MGSSRVQALHGMVVQKQIHVSNVASILYVQDSNLQQDPLYVSGVMLP